MSAGQQTLPWGTPTVVEEGAQRGARTPLVGIVGHGYDVPRPFGSIPVTGTPQSFLEAVARCGARPVVLPPWAGPDLLDVVDGLVLTGGGDVDPQRSGASGAARDVDPARDDAELTLVHAARAARVPLLGVCRGLQILNVASGGTLVSGIDHLRPTAGHEVRTAAGSLVRELLGSRSSTSALHHQAIGDLGAWWQPTAWAEDGIVEAIEPLGQGWSVLGVQWHPELSWHRELADDTGPQLFGWLVRAAGEHHRRRELGAGNPS